MTQPDDAAADGTGNAVALPDIFDLHAAESLHPALCARLASGGPVVVDAAAVARVGTPGVQLLITAQRAAQARGVAFAVRAPSAVFAAAVRDLGADVLLAEGTA